MRLKSFYANTMTEAMQMVRDALGEDAVIVATREERNPRGVTASGGVPVGVRVTAAIDPSYGYADSPPDYDERMFMEKRPAAAAPSRDNGYDDDLNDGGRNSTMRGWLQYDDENDNAAIVEDITDALLRHAVSEEVMDQVLSCATVVGLESSGVSLMAAIEHLFHFTPLPTGAHDRAIMMAGPPGAGKTLTVAKMAARGVMNGLRVGVVSCDTVRAGGIEQLRTFTNLLRIDLQKAESPRDLAAVLDDMQAQAYDQIIIDTAGINPFDKDEVKLLARLIGAGEIDPYMVLPAGLDAEESGETARVFATIGAYGMIPTRIDIGRRVGGLLSAAHQGGLGFADAGNTPKVADGLTSLSPRTLSQLIMPAAFRV